MEITFEVFADNNKLIAVSPLHLVEVLYHAIYEKGYTDIWIIYDNHKKLYQ